MTKTELKAQNFDILCQLEQLQRQLQINNQEILKLQETENSETVKE